MKCELGTICSRLSSGKNISAKLVHNQGKYPVYGGNGLRGYTDICNFDGECAIIGRQGAFCGNVHYFKGSAYMTEHAVVVCADENNNTRYLAYLLSTMQLGRLSAQSAQPGLSVKMLSKQIIELPPLEVQNQVANLLTALDDKIELNSKINDNLQQQLLTLYGNMILSAPAAMCVELKALCNFQEGYVNPSQTHPEYFDGDIKWLRAVDINESFIINTSRTLTTTGFESAKKSAILFQPNTIAISKSGTIGRLGIIADFMCGNRAVINIAPHNPKHLPLIYAYLKSRQREIPDMAVGSVQKNLYVSILEPLVVNLPEQKTLISFCNAGQTILDAICNNCKENNTLVALRDTLLPKLISGEIDVSDVQI